MARSYGSRAQIAPLARGRSIHVAFFLRMRIRTIILGLVSTTTLPAVLATLIDETLAHRCHLALADAHALWVASGGATNGTPLAAGDEEQVAADVAYLAHWLDRAPTAVERRAFAACLRAAARDWCHERADHEAARALTEDERRDWGTTCSLPADREARAGADRALAALARAVAPTAADAAA